MKARLIPIATLTLLGATSALAQSSEPPPGIGVSIGLRAFANQASGTGYYSAGIPGLNPVSAPVTTDTELSFLPSVALRYGRFIAAGSYHVKTTYSSVDAMTNSRIEFDRTEWDASVGYLVLPSVALSAGWKTAKFTPVGSNNPGLSQEYAGPFLGVLASAPLTGGWSLYGTFAYGWPDLKIGGNKAGSSGTYFASEVGLAYSLKGLSAALDKTSLIIGYRSQSMRVKNVPVGALMADAQGGLSYQNTSINTRDGIDGITIGLTVAF